MRWWCHACSPSARVTCLSAVAGTCYLKATSMHQANRRGRIVLESLMSAVPTPQSLPPVLASRLQKELHALATQPPPGVTCWPVSDSDITKLHATILASKGSCYEGGVFTVEVQVPMRYPFEPPKARFITPV